MKTRLRKISKKALSTVMAILMVLSTLTVSMISANADNNDKNNWSTSGDYYMHDSVFGWTSGSQKCQKIGDKYYAVFNLKYSDATKYYFRFYSAYDRGDVAPKSANDQDATSYHDVGWYGSGAYYIDLSNNTKYQRVRVEFQPKGNNNYGYVEASKLDLTDIGVSLKANNSTNLTVNKGDTVTLSATASGDFSSSYYDNGEGGRKIKYTYQAKKGSGSYSDLRVNNNKKAKTDSYSWTPSSAGVYTLKAYVNDDGIITSSGNTINAKTGDRYAVSSEITVTVKDKYTVSYNKGTVPSGGGSITGTVNNQTKIQDTNLTLSSNTYSTTAYTQTGWATSDGGAKAYDLGGTYSANQAVTLYPFWTENDISLTVANNINATTSTVTAHPATTCTVTAPTVANHHITGWKVTSGSIKIGGTTYSATGTSTISTAGNLTGVTATAAATLKAQFDIDTYDLTLTQPSNGSITYNSSTTSPVSISHGTSNVAVVITPDSGYKISALYDNGTLVPAASDSTTAYTYTISSFTEAHTITATMAVNDTKYNNITVDKAITSGDSSSARLATIAVTPSTASDNVSARDGMSVTASNSDDGYSFVGWTSTDGNFADESNANTTFYPTDDNAVAVANYAEITHTVSVVSNNTTYGTVSPSSVSGVGKYTASANITASAKTGYHFVSWTIPTGVTLASGYQATNATIKVNATADSKTITAVFAKNSNNITVSVGGGYSENQGYTITNNPAGAHDYLDSISFTITAKTGYNFPTVSFSGVTPTITGTTTKTYTFNMPNNAVTITITPNPITPTAEVNYKTYSNASATSTTSATVTKRLTVPTFTLTNYSSYPAGATYEIYRDGSVASNCTFSAGVFTPDAFDSVGAHTYVIKVTLDGKVLSSNSISVTTNDYVALTVPSNADGTVAVTYINDCGTANQTVNSGDSVVYAKKDSTISATATFVNLFSGKANAITLLKNGVSFQTQNGNLTSLTGTTTVSEASTITATFSEDAHQTIYLLKDSTLNSWDPTNVYVWYKDSSNHVTEYTTWNDSYQINQEGAGHTAVFQNGDPSETRTYYIYKMYTKDSVTYDKWNNLIFSKNHNSSYQTGDTALVDNRAYELTSSSKKITDSYNAENKYSVYIALKADDEAEPTYDASSSAGTITASTGNPGNGVDYPSRKRVIVGTDQQVVTLTAAANTGYTFNGWTLGDGVTITGSGQTASSASITIKTSQVSNVQANFTHTKYYPTYTPAPNSEYTITGPDYYYYNSTLNFSVTPNQGYGIDTVKYQYAGEATQTTIAPTSGNNYSIANMKAKNVTITVTFREVASITYYVDMHDVTVASDATMKVENVTDITGNTVITNNGGVPYSADIGQVGTSTIYSGRVETPNVASGQPLYVKITIGTHSNVLSLDYTAAAKSSEVWVELVKRGYTESRSEKATYNSNLTDSNHRRIIIRKNYNYFTDSDSWGQPYALVYTDGIGSDTWRKLEHIGNKAPNALYYLDINKADNRLIVKNDKASGWTQTDTAVIDDASMYQFYRDGNVKIQKTGDDIIFPHIGKYETDIYLDKDTTDTFVLDRSEITGAKVESTVTRGSGTVINFDNTTGIITPLAAGTATIKTKAYSSLSKDNTYLDNYTSDIREVTATIHVYDSKEITGFALMSYEHNETTFGIKNTTGGQLQTISTKLSGVGNDFTYTNQPGIISESGSGTAKTFTVKYAKSRADSDYSNINLRATITSVPVEATSGMRYGFKQWLIGDTPQTISTSTTQSEHYYERVTTSSNIPANGSAYLAEYIEYVYTDVHFTFNYYEYKIDRTAGTGKDGTEYAAGKYYQYDTNYVYDDPAEEGYTQAKFLSTHNARHYDEIIEFRATEYDSQRAAAQRGLVLDVDETSIIQALANANFRGNLENDYYDYTIESTSYGTPTKDGAYDMYVTVTLKQNPKHYSVTYNGNTTSNLYYQQYVELTSSTNTVQDWFDNDTNKFLARGKSYRFRVYKNTTLRTAAPADAASRVGLKTTIDYTGYDITNEDFTKTVNGSPVTYTNAELLRQNFYIADFYNDKMATYEENGETKYHDDVNFVGGGVAYFSVDETGKILKLNQKYRTTETVGGNEVEVADTEAIAAAIKSNIEEQELPVGVTDDTNKTVVYGTEIQPTVDRLYGSSTGLVYRYMPYNKYNVADGKYIRQTDVFRYSNALGAYQYIYHTKDLNLEKNDGKLMRVYSYYVYSYTSYVNEAGEETGGHTEYRVVISDSSAQAPTYVSAK